MQRMFRQLAHNMKILLLGQSGVGKSVLVYRHRCGSYSERIPATMCFEIIDTDICIGKVKCHQTLFDTSGLPFTKEAIRTNYAGSDAALICFALDDRESLGEAENYIKEYRQAVGEEATILLVGTRADSERFIAFDEAKVLADSYQLGYVECSALNGMNVDLVFQEIAKLVLQKRQARVAAVATPVNGRCLIL